MTVALRAKGTTVGLIVSGPGLRHPLTVISQEAIDANVWTGDFFDASSGHASAPPADWPRYQIQFKIAPARGEIRMMYAVDFVWNANADRALVYLPGRGDERYYLNTHTVLRADQDGHWFYAAPKWGRAIRHALP